MILGYQIPWNNFDFAYQVYIALERTTHRTEDRGAREVRVTAAPALRGPRLHQVARALHGTNVSVGHAECFQVYRIVA